IGLLGWRLTWVAAAVVLVAVAIPVLIVLLRRERVPTTGPAAPDGTGPDRARREWTRREVVRSRLFYALMAGVLAQPFILTGIFFNQVTIVAIKGWQLSWFAASFPVLAGVNIVSALGAGWMVDRFSARRLLPAFLIPLGLATMMLIWVPDP